MGDFKSTIVKPTSPRATPRPSATATMTDDCAAVDADAVRALPGVLAVREPEARVPERGLFRLEPEARAMGVASILKISIWQGCDMLAVRVSRRTVSRGH